MIIGVMSDSHGDYQAIEKAVKKIGVVDLWLHAGDCCTDAEFLKTLTGIQTIAVAGNCDWPNPQAEVDEFIEVDGLKLWLTHGHRYEVKLNTHLLVDSAKQQAVNIAIYGHTHILENRHYGDVLVLNPGSVARPYFGAPSFMKLRIEKQVVTVEVLFLP